MNKLTLILAAGLALSPLASAQTLKPEERNAALKYATIFYTESAEASKAAALVDMSKVGFDKAKLPEEFTNAVKLIHEQDEGAVGQLIAASKLAKCDFEIPMEEGWNVLLPHLGKMRAAARLLRVDARRCAINGDSAGAAERLMALTGIARHAANDHVLISSLVSAAIANVAAEEAEAEAEVLSPEARQQVAAALAGLTRNDPFQMKAAIRGEQYITSKWIKAKFQGPNAGQEYSRAMAPLEGQVSGAQTNAAKALSVMNAQQLGAAADLLNPYYSEAIAAWDQTDAVEKLTKLGGRVEGGEFGPLATVLAPAFAKARASEMKAVKRISEVAEKLGAK